MVMDSGTLKRSSEKHRHASYLFKEMGKFQKGGILCDVKVSGELQLVPAHRIVLMSARSSEGDHPKTPVSSDDKKMADFYQQDDVFLEEAYSSGTEDCGEDTSSVKSPSESVEERLGTLNDLRHQHCCCDVTLVTDDCKCDAHKVVLAACSEYFRAMFTLKMKENKMSIIYLQSINGGYFQRTLDFIYTGELHIDDVGDSIELLNLAVFFQIQSMVEHCTQYLIDNVNSNVVCVLSCVARDLALNELLTSCCTYMHDHFIELDSASTDIDLLHPDDLIACLTSERLGGESNSQTEFSILRIVLRWLLRNRDKYSEEVQDKIVSNVRFSLIQPMDIMVSCRQIISEQNTCNKNSNFEIKNDFGSVFRRHLLGALKYHQEIYQQPLMQSTTTRLRAPVKSWISVDGVTAPSTVRLPTRSNKITALELLKPPEKSERPIRDPFHSVVEMNGFVFVIGGTRSIDEGYSRTVIRYDPRLDVCVNVASMVEERGDFVAVSFGGYIYVFGGRNRRGALNTAERYDPTKNAWETVARLPERLYMAAGLACREKIYITGGFNDYETVGAVFCFDPKANSWESIFSPMMAERGYHAMVEGHDGQLWVVGGVDNPFSGRNVWEVEAFDVDSRMWNFIGQVLPVPLFLSTIRLNILINDAGRICVSAASFPEKYAMLEYNVEQRMWFEMKTKAPCYDIKINSSKT